jgi:hypothetical protein
VPKAPTPAPQDKDQVNFTDEESRLMPGSGGGFEQAYNGQIGVDGDSRLIVCQHLSQQPNDKQGLVPALDHLAQLPEELGKVETASADTGYYSEDNVGACEKADVVPYIACGREPHYPPLAERLEGPFHFPAASIPAQLSPLRGVRLRSIFSVWAEVGCLIWSDVASADRDPRPGHRPGVQTFASDALAPGEAP